MDYPWNEFEFETCYVSGYTGYRATCVFYYKNENGKGMIARAGKHIFVSDGCPKEPPDDVKEDLRSKILTELSGVAICVDNHKIIIK